MYTSTNKGEMPWAGETPILVKFGVPHWQARSGRTFPLVIAGAEDPPADPDKPTDPPSGDDPPEKWDEDRARRTIEKQREEARTLRAQLKEFDALKAKDAQREREKLSETERLAAEKADLEKKLADHEALLRTMRTDHTIERAATAQGARKPAIVARLIDREAIKYDSEGTPLNAEDLVKDLLKAEPYLVGTTASGSGVPASPRSNGQPQGREAEVEKLRNEMRASGNYEI